MNRYLIYSKESLQRQSLYFIPLSTSLSHGMVFPWGGGRNVSLNLCKSKSSSLFTLFLKMVFHYLIEEMCHRNKYTICTVFVCTHAVGRGRDKGLSFLTHCLVTLSGYDRTCTFLFLLFLCVIIIIFFLISQNGVN